MEVLTDVVRRRLREASERAVRVAIREAMADAETSRPLEDLLGVLVDLVSVGADGSARVQSLGAAIARDALSYAVAALVDAEILNSRGCGDGERSSLHIRASAVYEALALSEVLGPLGFPAATGSVPNTCGEFATSVIALVDAYPGGTDLQNWLERLQELPLPNEALNGVWTGTLRQLLGPWSTCNMLPWSREVTAGLDRASNPAEASSVFAGAVGRASTDTAGGSAACATTSGEVDSARLSTFVDYFDQLAGHRETPPTVGEVDSAVSYARAVVGDVSGPPTVAPAAGATGIPTLQLVSRLISAAQGDVASGAMTRELFLAILDGLELWITDGIDDAVVRRALLAAVRALQTSTRFGERGQIGNLSVDPVAFVAAYTSEFGSARDGDWEFYPRANVGLGYLLDDSLGGAIPVGYEEIGLGVRFLWRPRPDVDLLLGAHIVASGLLISITDANGAGRDSVFVGAGLDLNVFRVIELSVSAGVLVDTGGATAGPRYGMQFGLQVPLYDYVIALSEAAGE
jgi:hypothetical protein